MPTHDNGPRRVHDLIEHSAAERARYLTMLGRWARAEITASDFGGSSNGVAPPAGK